MKIKYSLYIVFLLTCIRCNNNVLYDSVYKEINATEIVFYNNLYVGINHTSNEKESEEIVNTYKNIFRKLSLKSSKYYIDTQKNFHTVWSNGGPDYCIWGMIWNNEKIIKFERCLYGKQKMLRIILVDHQDIKENLHDFLVFDLVNRWDTTTIIKLNWKSITDFYSDTTLVSYVDSINKARNYDLPLGITDSPAYTAAKVDLSASDIETIIFRLP